MQPFALRILPAVLAAAWLAGCSGSMRLPSVDVGHYAQPPSPALRSAGMEQTAGASIVSPAPAPSAPTFNPAYPAQNAALVIPEGGVDMDRELGVASASQPGTAGISPQIVTADGAMAMAEGSTSQPVVDGIGFDNPVALASAGAGSDAGHTAIARPAHVSTTTPAIRAAPAGNDPCALFLDRRNCRSK